MFGAAGAVREEGLLGVVLDPFACAGTLILAGVFARPLWNKNIFTMADFYRQTYGPAAELTGGLIQVPSYFAWIALQYSALASLLELFFAIPIPVGLILVAIITLAYTLIGGMWSVTLTDTLQILVAIAGLVVLTSAALSDPLLGNGNPLLGTSVLFEKIRMNHPHHLNFWPDYAVAGSLTAYVTAVLSVLAAWATGLFGNIPGQDLQQRVFSARDATTAPRLHSGWAALSHFRKPSFITRFGLTHHASRRVAGSCCLSRQCLSFSRNAHYFRHCSCFHDRLNGYECSVGTRYYSGT